MKVLVTGGAGYIGSHTVVALQQAGHEAVILDNFSNSKRQVIDRIAEITKIKPELIEVDLCSEDLKDGLDAGFDAVIHFAALKAVGESVQDPLRYYRNNVFGLLNLLGSVKAKVLVFSSSATVYGNPKALPIKEDAPLQSTNPYGETKLICERILTDLAKSDSNREITILRYFNPIGAHHSGLIGEDPSGTPSNLLPYISQVAVGKLPFLKVFGSDYETPDGTGVRDYIHVMDLAEGHVAALSRPKKGVATYNLGTGKGYTVLEIVKTFESISGQKIPFKLENRRPGDIAACYADPSLAFSELGWKAKLDLRDMCRDAWHWQSNNPNGYA